MLLRLLSLSVTTMTFHPATTLWDVTGGDGVNFKTVMDLVNADIFTLSIARVERYLREMR